MPPSARRLALSLVVLAGAPAVACSQHFDHAPPASTACVPGEPCTIGGGGTSVGAETGIGDSAAVSDGFSDGGLEIAVTGEVRSLLSFTAAPSTGALTSTAITVVGQRADGSFLSAAPAGGVFTLLAVGRSTDGAWLGVQTSGVDDTLAWIDTSGGDLTGVDLPLYDPALAASTAVQMGVVSAVVSPATVVLHLVDATGKPVAGVATMTVNYVDQTRGFSGPYFDNGDTLTSAAKTTGQLGTIVYFGVDPTVMASGFTVSLLPPTGTATSVAFAVKADVVSYRAYVIP